MTVSIPDFSRAKVLVAGDVMLDRYLFGGTGRISPEAPVPVVHVQQTEDRAGGARSQQIARPELAHAVAVNEMDSAIYANAEHQRKYDDIREVEWDVGDDTHGRRGQAAEQERCKRDERVAETAQQYEEEERDDNDGRRESLL